MRRLELADFRPAAGALGLGAALAQPLAPPLHQAVLRRLSRRARRTICGFRRPWADRVARAASATQASASRVRQTDLVGLGGYATIRPLSHCATRPARLVGRGCVLGSGHFWTLRYERGLFSGVACDARVASAARSCSCAAGDGRLREQFLMRCRSKTKRCSSNSRPATAQHRAANARQHARPRQPGTADSAGPDPSADAKCSKTSWPPCANNWPPPRRSWRRRRDEKR